MLESNATVYFVVNAQSFEKVFVGLDNLGGAFINFVFKLYPSQDRQRMFGQLKYAI